MLRAKIAKLYRVMRSIQSDMETTELSIVIVYLLLTFAPESMGHVAVGCTYMAFSGLHGAARETPTAPCRTPGEQHVNTDTDTCTIRDVLRAFLATFKELWKQLVRQFQSF